MGISKTALGSSPPFLTKPSSVMETTLPATIEFGSVTSVPPSAMTEPSTTPSSQSTPPSVSVTEPVR